MTAPLPDGVEPAFARSVRFWSRAYPRRWRAARGDELLGLLVDLAAPGARRLDARSALDLVRAGWATRLREHPPLGPWVLYRVLGTRSLTGHRPWVADDIAGALYPARQGSGILVIFLALEVFSRAIGAGAGPFGRYWYVLLGSLPLSLLIAPEHTRRRAMENHLAPRRGEVVAPGAWVPVTVPRRRVAARSGLPWLAGALTVVLAFAVAAAAAAPTTVWFRRNLPDEGPGFGVFDGAPVSRVPVLVVLAVAALGGAALAVAASRRLRRVSPAEQTMRQLTGMGVRRPIGVVLAVAAAAALPVLELLGGAPLAMSLPLGIVAGVLAPPALVTWAVVRRAPTGTVLAATDAWRIALTGRPPIVDRPATALVPADEHRIGAVEPWPWSNEGPTTALG